MRIQIILAALLLTADYTAVAQTLPTALIGNWQIEHVGIDDWNTSTHYGIPDDPFLVGRRVVISNVEISSPMSTVADCKTPAINSGPTMALDKLVEMTRGDRQSAPAKPVAKDFDLAFQGSQQVTPMMLSCEQGKFADEGVKIKAWLVVADKNTLLVSGNMSSILTLKRLPADALPSPSFKCNKATKVDEKTICGSFDLAAWDMSVNDAYGAAKWQLKQVDDKQAFNNTVKSQQAWIKQREKCGEDKQCLYQSMFNRIDQLSENY